MVTDALRRVLDEEELTITLIATVSPRAETAFEGSLLEFQGLQLATFD